MSSFEKHKNLLRELAIRTNVKLPESEKEERWFNEGTEKGTDFLHRLNMVLNNNQNKQR